MPCYDSRDDPSYIEADYKKRMAAIENRADTNARVACEALSMIENSSRFEPASISRLSDDTRRWWKTHKEFDKKRKK